MEPDLRPELADMAVDGVDAYLASIEAQSAWGARQLAKTTTAPVAVSGEPKPASPMVAASAAVAARVARADDRHVSTLAELTRRQAWTRPVDEAEGFATYAGNFGA